MVHNIKILYLPVLSLLVVSFVLFISPCLFVFLFFFGFVVSLIFMVLNFLSSTSYRNKCLTS